MATFRTFEIAIQTAQNQMRRARPFVRGSWQGTDVSARPEMQTYEVAHFSMLVPMTTTDLTYYQRAIKPNLPWADDHFLERVGGHPLNPGTEWRNWPWGTNADKFRMDPLPLGDPGPDRIFDHTYSQRYWPKYAGTVPGGILPTDLDLMPHDIGPRLGIYFLYGDLGDIVRELEADPTTRQAILPVFFPEDTGLRPGRRKPCSIFYQFILNQDMGLDIVYYLRSCDLVRHFRDDIYLTVRLLLWMLEQLRVTSSELWKSITPGTFAMHIGNLHCFANDMIRLQQGQEL